VSIYQSEPFLAVDAQTNQWFQAFKPRYTVFEKGFKEDLALVDRLKAEIEPVPEWALLVRHPDRPPSASDDPLDRR
jgi:hypothetical protein